MISLAQEKKIKSLHTKKGREKHGLCLVEGKKVIEAAGDAVEVTFSREDTLFYDELVTTQTPQDIAGIAKVPKWTLDDIRSKPTVVVLDGVQDPGNVGAILRLCIGFNASLILVDSVDVTSPKVVRSSVGTMFHVPWLNVSRGEVTGVIGRLGRPVYKLEAGDGVDDSPGEDEIVLIAGSEGNGIKIDVKGKSYRLKHDPALESLNVGHAVAIALHSRYTRT